MLDHINLPQYVPQPGYRLDAAEEDFSPADSWLDFGIYVLQNFQNPTGLFWNAFTGCSANGFGTPPDNPRDPACHGGTANVGAPLDVWRQLNPNWQQVQLYCQECETAGPPFAIVRDPETLPVASDNPAGRTNNVPSGKTPAGPARWNGPLPPLRPTSDTPGPVRYDPPYVAPRGN
jgi:hypothetical protein